MRTYKCLCNTSDQVYQKSARIDRGNSSIRALRPVLDPKSDETAKNRTNNPTYLRVTCAVLYAVYLRSGSPSDLYDLLFCISLRGQDFQYQRFAVGILQGHGGSDFAARIRHAVHASFFKIQGSRYDPISGLDILLCSFSQ